MSRRHKPLSQATLIVSSNRSRQARHGLLPRAVARLLIVDEALTDALHRRAAVVADLAARTPWLVLLRPSVIPRRRAFRFSALGDWRHGGRYVPASF